MQLLYGLKSVIADMYSDRKIGWVVQSDGNIALTLNGQNDVKIHLNPDAKYVANGFKLKVLYSIRIVMSFASITGLKLVVLFYWKCDII